MLVRSGVRFHLRRPVQLALALFGVALGVAVVAAMFIAIDSAKRGFDHANEAVFGHVSHVLRGGPAGIDERLFTRIRLQWPTIAAAPVVLGQIAIGTGQDRRRLQLLGIDPFADARFRSYSPSPESAVLPRFLSEPRTVVLSEHTARREGVGVDDKLRVRVAGRVVELRVLAVLSGLNELQRAALDQVLVVDIATAQELLGTIGKLSRIDLNVRGALQGSGVSPVNRRPVTTQTSALSAEHADVGSHAVDAALRGLRAVLPADVRVEPGSASATAREQMTRAFYLNLRMLSVLALVVGLFIIYNAVSFSVVQRRTLFGTLRAIGVTGREILVVVLSEALILAVLASIIGLPLGVMLAEVLLALVTRTVEDLYFLSAVRAVHVDASTLLPAICLGLIGSLLAALMPALEATAIPARAAMSASHLERGVRAALPKLAGAGVCAALFCAVLLAGDHRGLVSAFVALFALVMSAVLFTPALTTALVRILQIALPARAGGIPLMALRGVRAGLSRSSVAIAALMVALATTVGVAVMVSSFRISLHDWLNATLRADIYVGVAGRGITATLPAGLRERIAALPQVRSVAVARDVTVSTDRGEVDLKAMTETEGAYRGLVMIHVLSERTAGTDETAAWQALTRADAVLISESLSWRLRLKAGEMLHINTASGARAVRVIGVFRDYASDRGLMIMGIKAYRALFDDTGVSGLAIHLRANTQADADQTVAGLHRAVGADMQVRVLHQARIRDASMAIFDRTFAITRVLQWLATLVACVGVLSALMALALERSKEMAVLRAQGMTRGELLVLLQVQSVAMGLIAGLLSLPLGTLMALVLTHVINRRAFGWGMEFHLPLEVLGHTMLVAVLAAVLAGLYPAWRLSRTNPARALRLA
ncbi:MAG: putative ABC transport system permease protein [Gammaproteobacteria bacterium]|jgi:putative ABC transport system permease protein